MIAQEDTVTRKLCYTSTVSEIHAADLSGRLLLHLYLLSPCSAQRATVYLLSTSSTALQYSEATVKGCAVLV